MLIAGMTSFGFAMQTTGAAAYLADPMVNTTPPFGVYTTMIILALLTVAILVLLSASLSFIAPLEPASPLAYGPAKYRFGDLIRVGPPLTILVLAVLVFVTPLLWPL